MENKSFEFNVSLLKYFWNNRERKRIPKPSGVTKQKFLFFYNFFAKINNKLYTFENLKAFKNGPLYFDIYNEISKNKDCYLEQLPIKNVYDIDTEIADVTMQLLYLYKSQISSITHSFDLWRNVYYNSGTNFITENDITRNDIIKANQLYKETKDVLKNYFVYYNENDIPLIIEKDKKDFIVKNFYAQLQFNTEDKLPVYVTEENGELYFD